MSSHLQTLKLTQELFDQFQCLWHFSVNEDNPNYNQGLYDMSLFSYIFLVDSKPIAVFGLVPLWNGVGECWMLGSPDLSNHKLSLIKILRKFTDHLLTSGLHRVQIYVNDTTAGHKWAKILGFTYEGTLRKHSIEGNDNSIYSKIWD